MKFQGFSFSSCELHVQRINILKLVGFLTPESYLVEFMFVCVFLSRFCTIHTKFVPIEWNHLAQADKTTNPKQLEKARTNKLFDEWEWDK